MSLETEIEGYKKSIQKEQEQNEKLTFVQNKTEVDIATVKKLLQQAQDKHDALKNEYATYTRMLNETEQALGRANTVIINVKFRIPVCITQREPREIMTYFNSMKLLDNLKIAF